MGDHPTVTTPGGTDIFAGLSSADYAAFSDESMAMLVDENLAAPLPAASRTTAPAFKSSAATGSSTSSAAADPYLMTPRTADFMAELAGSTTPAAPKADPAAMLFDHDLVTNGLGQDDDEDELRQDDLPTPLNFTFTPTGGGATAGSRYHIAAAHKHKRVRSNPDVLQSFSYQQMMGANTSPLRPSVDSANAPHGSVSLPTTPMDASGDVGLSTNGANFEPMPAPLPISIGTVNVVTPVGFHVGDNNTDASRDSFPSDMDSFLKEMQWSELAENNNSMNVDTLGSLPGDAGYRTQRIQAGMNELKMKRKRPTQHMRHHSNPVDLLHNLDQFRLLSQQQQGQHQVTPPPSPPPMQFPSPTKLGNMMPIQHPQQMQGGLPPQMMAQPNQFVPHGMMMQDMQFQVPTDIANGSARSLHSRRSSMPNSAFARGRNHRRAASRGSTGLSMDMSQLNLEFLTLPEDEFQQQLQHQRQQQAFQHAMSGQFPSPPSSPPLQDFQQQLQNSPPKPGGFMGELEMEKNRKSYKCGRCGKPKVGHVCTMPDLRNNWSQVDIEVTKGIKVVRVNCHIVATKNKWIPQHEDNL